MLSEVLWILPSFCFSPMNRNSVLAELKVKRWQSSKKRHVQEHYVGGQETARVFRVCEGRDPHKLTSGKSRGHVPRCPGCSISGEANVYRTGRLVYKVWNRHDTDCKCANDVTQNLYKLLTLFKNINSPDQLEWAPQARGPLCFAHAAQFIATPLGRPTVLTVNTFLSCSRYLYN